MKKRIIYTIIILFHALLYVINNIFAYVTLPNISYAQSIMTDVFGFGWTGVIITQVLVYFLSSVTLYYSFFIYKAKYPKKRLREYIGTAVAALGFAGTFTNISVFFVFIPQWIMGYYYPNAYLWYIKNIKYRFEPLTPSIIVETIVFILSLMIWINSEYKKFKKESEQ